MGDIRILLLTAVSFSLHCLGRGGVWSILFVLVEGLDIHKGPLGMGRKAIGKEVGGGVERENLL